MKKLAILGSTGSIGTQALQVVDAFPTEFKVVALAANNNIDLLFEQAQKYSPIAVAVGNIEKAKQLENRLNQPVLKGKEGVESLAAIHEVDIVLNSLVGFSGLKPTLVAVENGKDIALANKEALVVGGDLLSKKAADNNVKFLPVDSEHSAIFQCLQAGSPSEVARIYLTASGGTFLNTPPQELYNVTAAQALRHPNWDMGAKITIDSATLMNKGLEVIEAHWLFNVDYEDITVVVHPQSIVHSMVEFIDGSVIAQLGPTDMFFPIQYALSYPKRKHNKRQKYNPYIDNNLTFQEPDKDKFPCLNLAYEAGKCGKTMPAALNAANEVAVSAFLKGIIKFTDISEIVREVLEKHSPENPDSFDVLQYVDNWARETASNIIFKGEN